MRGDGCPTRGFALAVITVLSVLVIGSGPAAAVHGSAPVLSQGSDAPVPDVGDEIPDADAPEPAGPSAPASLPTPPKMEPAPNVWETTPDVPAIVNSTYDDCANAWGVASDLNTRFRYPCEYLKRWGQPVLVEIWNATFSEGQAPESMSTGMRSSGENALHIPHQVNRSSDAGTFQSNQIGAVPVASDLPFDSGLFQFVFKIIALAGVSLAFLYLYRRLEGDEVLKHDARSTMMDIVKDRPGINEATLARELDVHPSTIRYHARILEEEGFLACKADGREIIYFRSDQTTDKVKQELLKTARKPAKRRVIQVVRDTPGLSLSEAARRLDVHPSTVKRHADTLIEKGVLEDERRSGQRIIRLSSQVRDNVNLVDQATAATDARIQNGG